MTYKVCIYFFCFFATSCNYYPLKNEPYLNIDSIANYNGIAKDSLAKYVPIVLRKNDSLQKFYIDDFTQEWFSSSLFALSEPLLYNNYFGNDVYRLLWLRNNFGPVVISLHKDGEKVWLQTKQLNKTPLFFEMKLSYPESYDSIKIKKSEIEIEDAKSNTIIIYNNTKTLTLKEWNVFENKIENKSFFNIEPYIDYGGAGQSETRCFMESHLKNKYWFAIRWTPNENLDELCNYLIEISGL